MNNIIWNLRDDITDINNIHVNLKNNWEIKLIYHFKIISF